MCSDYRGFSNFTWWSAIQNSAYYRYTRMMLILTRISYEFHTRNTPIDKLNPELDKSLSSSPEHLINNNSTWFEDFLRCGHPSEFRASVLSLVGIIISNFSTKERPDRIEDSFTGFENFYDESFFPAFEYTWPDLKFYIRDVTIISEMRKSGSRRKIKEENTIWIWLHLLFSFSEKELNDHGY